MFPSRNDWTIKLHAVVKFLFFLFITTPEKKMCLLLYQPKYWLRRAFLSISSPEVAFASILLLFEGKEKKVNDCGLVAQIIFRDEKLSLKSFLPDC